jgi:hypothetical protein
MKKGEKEDGETALNRLLFQVLWVITDHTGLGRMDWPVTSHRAHLALSANDMSSLNHVTGSVPFTRGLLTVLLSTFVTIALRVVTLADAIAQSV